MLTAGAIEHPALRSCIRMGPGRWAVRGTGDKHYTFGATLTEALQNWHAKQLPALPPLPLL